VKKFYHQARETEGGFTLLEIMVAIAIMAVGLVTVIQLFSGALRSARLSEDYSRAVIGAKKKMDYLLSVRNLEDFDEIEKSGQFEESFLDGYSWYIEALKLYNLPEELKRDIEDQGYIIEDLEWKLYEIAVVVSWGGQAGREKKVRFVTLKLFRDQGDENF